MWLAKQLAGSVTEQSVAEFGSISIDGNQTAVVTEGERRGVSTVFPGGYTYCVQTGETVAVLHCGNTELIQGVVVDKPPDGLEPGEVKITAAGGTAIWLKNDGSIRLYGNVTVSGTLTTEGEQGTELKLKDGCYIVSNAGGFVTVSGYEELAQRVSMKLRARRGGFALLPDFGSRLYLLGQTRVSERETAARQYVAEALSDEENLILESISVFELAEGMIQINMEFTYNGEFLRMTTTI